MRKLLRLLSTLIFAPVIFIYRVFLVVLILILLLLAAILTAGILSLLALADICVSISGTRTGNANAATDTFLETLWSTAKDSVKGLGNKKWKA